MRVCLRTTRARALALLVAAAAGCSFDFDDPSTVKDLRILAIVAEPPEILIDAPEIAAVVEAQAPLADALAQASTLAGRVPDPVGVVKLKPLVVDPRGGGRPVAFELRVCGNRLGTRERGRDRGAGRVRDTIARGPCPSDAPVVAAGHAMPEGDPPGIVLPIEIEHTIGRAFLLAAVRDDPLGVVLGLPVEFELTVRAGDEQEIAVKRVVIAPRLRADQQENANPPRPGLAFRAGRDGDPVPPPPRVAPGAKLVVAPEALVGEPYVQGAIRSLDGRPYLAVIEREALRFTFFATSGSFAPQEITTEPPPGLTRPPALETTYEAPDAPAPEEAVRGVSAWVVVRDERAGATVMPFTIRVAPHAP